MRVKQKRKMKTLGKAEVAKGNYECISIYKSTKINLVSRAGGVSTEKSPSLSDSSNVNFEGARYNEKA